MALGEIFTAPIEGLVTGGAGLARLRGRPVFIEAVAPGDVITGKIIEEKSGYSRGELVNLVESSSHRVEPGCPLYGLCGGCNLQHLDYPSQLEQKERILRDTLRRIGKVEQLPPLVVVPSKPYGYRNRMQFHRLPHRGNRGETVGLIKRQSTIPLPIGDCPIADDPIRSALRKGTLTPPPLKDRFTVYGRGDLLLLEGAQSQGIVPMGDKKIRMDAQLFFQSNADLLEVLIKDLIRLARKADPTRAAADIYCGVGTFSVFLSDIFPSLTLVEQNPRSLELAKQNLAGKRAEFYPLSESEWVTKQKKGSQPFGFMVLDPPRLGLSSILRDYIVQRGPPLVAYVSCDPATLARDTKELVAGAYTLGALTLYDFYPQTAHIETLAFFERSS